MKRILPLTIMLLVSAACLAQKPCSLPKVKGLDKKYSDAVDLLSENQDLGIKYLNEISIDYPKYYPATLLLGEYYLNKQRDAQLRFQTDRALEFSQKAQRNLSLSFEFCPTHDSCRAGFTSASAAILTASLIRPSGCLAIFSTTTTPLRRAVPRRRSVLI